MNSVEMSSPALSEADRLAAARSEIARTRAVLHDFDHTGGNEPLWDVAQIAVDQIRWENHKAKCGGIQEGIERERKRCEEILAQMMESMPDIVSRECGDVILDALKERSS